MITPYGFLGHLLLQTLAICAVFAALCDIARNAFKLDEFLTFCTVVFLLGLLGYLTFWLAYVNYALLGVAKVALLAGLLIWFGVVCYRRRIGDYRWLAEPLLYTSLFCIVVLTLGFSAGGLEDPGVTAQHRFSHPLPGDNFGPLVFAELLKLGTLSSPKLGEWLTSDRPPLQVGLHLLLSLRYDSIHYQIVSAWLQSTFLFGVWGVMVASAALPTARRVVLLACCLLPTAIINTFFVWPKMLAVGYLLLVFALLFCRKPGSESERKVFGVLIGGLAALAVLSHGSSMFMLLGFTVAVLVFWAWPPLQSMIYGAIALIGLYLPWIYFQNFIDPPGNRLLKWHLAGVTDIDKRSFLRALRDQYGAMSWHEHVQLRLDNLWPLIGVWPRGVLDPLIGPFTGRWTPAATRGADFFHLLPSLHMFSIAMIVAIALVPWLPAAQRAVALRMIVALVGTLVVFVLLIMLPAQTINHVNSYAVQVLLTVFAFMVLTLRLPWLALIFIAAQAVTMSATYAFSLPHDPRQWPLLALCIAASLALVGYSLVPRFVRTAEPARCVAP